jgi:hypothetical protein
MEYTSREGFEGSLALGGLIEEIGMELKLEGLCG